MSARGDIVVWTDIDMTYPNDEIPELVSEISGYDQVVGARRTEAGTVKFLRKPAKWFIRTLAAYLAGTPIPDLNSGFRAFRRDVADQFLYLLQVVRMILMHEPLRFFGPLALALGGAGLGKLVYDLIDKNFRVGTNTIVILGVALAFAGVGVIADVLVQINKRRHDVMPATADSTPHVG